MNKVNELMARMMVVASGQGSSSLPASFGLATSGIAPSSSPSTSSTTALSAALPPAKPSSPYSKHTSVFTRLVDQLPIEKSPTFRGDILHRLEGWITSTTGFDAPVPPAARTELLKLWDTLLYLVEDKFGACL